MPQNDDEFNFERAMGELAKLVEQLEEGDLGLEQSVKCVEQGVRIADRCERALNEAEQKVQSLVEREGRSELEPFPTGEEKDR